MTCDDTCVSSTPKMRRVDFDLSVNTCVPNHSRCINGFMCDKMSSLGALSVATIKVVEEEEVAVPSSVSKNSSVQFGKTLC